MLSYSELKPGVLITLDGEPYEVLSATTVKKQRQKPTNQTKLRNLLSGNVVERTFHQSDTLEEAAVDEQDVEYLYSRRGASFFADPDNPKDRFSLPAEQVSEQLRYLTPNMRVTALKFRDEVVSIKIPIKVDLKVTEAPPNVKGNTAQGGTKPVTLETGISVTTPMFVEAGDTIRVNTETGEYVERVKK